MLAPVIPAGNGGAGCGANGLLGAGAGVGVAVCASVDAARHEYKKTKAAKKPNTRIRPIFLISPLMIVAQHFLHDPDLGPLAAIYIRREIEKVRVLAGARRGE